MASGKAIPYGVLDIAANRGFVHVGITNETAQFSVASIRAWWQQLGRERYPEAKTLQITADCGGSNGNRTRLWKTELQGLADETGLEISVCHFPPGTSKWNRIEHRLWSFVSHNWRGKPLVSFEVIISPDRRDHDPVPASRSTPASTNTTTPPRSRSQTPSSWQSS